MGAASTARVFAAAALWRLGMAGAGRSIVDAAATGDEDTSTAAGMLLTRAGDRAVPLVADALEAGSTSLVLVDVLAGIGTDAALHELRSLAASAEGEVVREAGEAVRRIEQRRRS